MTYVFPVLGPVAHDVDANRRHFQCRAVVGRSDVGSGDGVGGGGRDGGGGRNPRGVVGLM